MLPVYDFDSEEFDRAVSAAGNAAFHETLAAGYPVFYLDADGLEVMELPDGRRFEIGWIPGCTFREQLRNDPRVESARSLSACPCSR
jgi:hypothetical protein